MAEQNLRVEDDQLPLELPKKNNEVEETIESLKAQIAERDKKAEAALATAEAERRARLDAEQRIVNSEQQVEQFKTQVQTAEQRALANAIDAANRESEAAQHELESAMASADYAAVGKAQAKIARAAAQLVQFEAAKAVYDQQAKAASQQVRVDVSQPRYTDPTEAFISGQNPRVQSWLRSHRDAIVYDDNGRPNFSPAAWAAHYDALAQGVKEGSDDYFQHLTDRVSPRAKPAADEDEAPEPVAPRRAAPVAAPVSRDPPGNNGQSQTRYRLSPDEVEMAKISGLTPQQYWENKQALKQEGRLGRTH